MHRSNYVTACSLTILFGHPIFKAAPQTHSHTLFHAVSFCGMFLLVVNGVLEEQAGHSLQSGT
jgi:hypothetical protein